MFTFGWELGLGVFLCIIIAYPIGARWQKMEEKKKREEFENYG